MEKLKPCPFCGSQQIEVRHVKDRWSVGCATTDCLCQWWYVGRQFNDRDRAIEAWNRRADEQSTIQQ